MKMSTRITLFNSIIPSIWSVKQKNCVYAKYLSRFFSADVFVHSGCDIDRWTCEMPAVGIRCDGVGCCCSGGRFGSIHNSNENSLSDGCIAIKSLSCASCSLNCDWCGSLCLSNISIDLPRLIPAGFCRISRIFRMSFLMLVSMVSRRDDSSVICDVSELQIKKKKNRTMKKTSVI